MSAARSIAEALRRHLEGIELAEQVAKEREQAHLKRLNESSWCPDCLSLCGEGVCWRHDKNREHLEGDDQ